MFYRSNTPVIPLVMLLTIAAISKPLTAAASPEVHLAQSAKTASPSSKHSVSPQNTGAKTKVLRQAAPTPTIAAKTKTVSIHHNDQASIPEQGALWGWLLGSVAGISLLAWRQIKGEQTNKSTIAAVEAIPQVSSSISQLLKKPLTPFSSNKRSIARSLRDATPAKGLTLLSKDRTANAATLTQQSAITSDAAPLNSSSHNQTQRLENDCKIVIQPLKSLTLANGENPSPDATQPQAVVRWTISIDRKLALQQQGEQTLVLRVYDATNIDLAKQPAHSFRQYHCDESATEMVIPILNSDREYVVEIGYLTQEGLLLRLAQSIK
ncbi:MAG TPA: DUF4912 domain-containing protein [Trichocoleus sp.]|jgi:hypothetical protein